MRCLSFSPLSTSLILLLSAFCSLALSIEPLKVESLPLVTRQETSCLQYSTVANLSTIGTNSTFRAAFLQAGPWGTNQAQGILDGATKTLLKLVDDPTVNQQCGNLTALAIQEAPNNFSQGIIGPFKVLKETMTPMNNGIDVLLVVGVALLLFGGITFAL